MDTQDFIDSILSHAAPKYYDPVKAHEYYLRNRELKGRNNVSELRSKRKKEAWGYSKHAIGEAKKAELEKAQESKNMQVDKARETAQIRRIEIREKLNVLFERIAQKSSDEAKAASAKIKALPPIPKGLSEEEAAKAAAERSSEIAKIRGDAKKSREDARASASSEREQVKTDLQATVDKARLNYEGLKEKIKAKYEKELDTEFEAIKQKV